MAAVTRRYIYSREVIHMSVTSSVRTLPVLAMLSLVQRCTQCLRKQRRVLQGHLRGSNLIVTEQHWAELQHACTELFHEAVETKRLVSVAREAPF